MTGATGRETSAPAFHPRLKPESYRLLLFVLLTFNTFNTYCAFSRLHGGLFALSWEPPHSSHLDEEPRTCDCAFSSAGKNGNKRTQVESEEAAALKASQCLRVVIVARALFGLCPPFSQLRRPPR